MGGADHAALLEKSRQIAEAAFDVSFGPFSEDNGHSARSRVFDRFERGRAPAEMAPQCAGDEVGEGGDFEQAVLVQALDLLGAHRDRRVAPAKADVGMMSLRLGELRRAADKRKGLAEVREPVGPLDPRCVVSQRPLRSLGTIPLCLLRRQWRNAAAARRAGFLGEPRYHHVSSLDGRLLATWNEITR